MLNKIHIKHTSYILCVKNVGDAQEYKKDLETRARINLTFEIFS